MVIFPLHASSNNHGYSDAAKCDFLLVISVYWKAQ